jgi:hypothetical protein
LNEKYKEQQKNVMTVEYKKYYQMIFSALDGINPRYWNKIRNKFTIDNNSIVLVPSKKGILVYLLVSHVGN